ncbi:MAG: Peptidyl-tRNA hydrolase [Chlamydiae bacterium]|nr:Peptidyl-tRNA hydrolase [Chlamydiota bacterium]
MTQERWLIVGLGNPGRDYDDTRHNVGFRIVKALAAKYAISLRPALVRAKGGLGDGVIREKKALLLLPLTFMNESGRAVRKCMDYYKVPMSQLIVVTDDVALPFGQLRIRQKGSPGGHNGLKSVQAYLGTEEYTRLRVGVGDQSKGELSDYVLGKFTAEEQQLLPDVVDRSTRAIELWLTEGTEAAMQEANRVGEE